MRTLSNDAATAFLRALCGTFGNFHGTFRVDELTSRSWASVTFSGARHSVAFTLEGEGAADAADAFVAAMADAEFDLRGHILADMTLAGQERSPGGERVQLRIEALTVEDD